MSGLVFISVLNQGPFGPAGLIHAAHENGGGGDLPFKRPSPPESGGQGYGMMPVNNNSFGLATAGKLLDKQCYN